MSFHKSRSPFTGKLADRGASGPVTLQTEIPVQEQSFLAGTEKRILRAMMVVACCGLVGIWLWRGWSWGLGFLLGALFSMLNFQWLKSAVNLLGRAATSQPAAPQPARRWPTIARFYLRYALIALVGYAIFVSSAVSLMAFLAGLFVSVIALMVEAGYQMLDAILTPDRKR